MFERSVARFVGAPVAFEIIRTNVEEHKAAGLAIEPTIKLFAGNPSGRRLHGHRNSWLRVVMARRRGHDAVDVL